MENIETSVRALLDSHDGHEFDHVDRVRKLALSFAKKENANTYIVELAALLHDVDDYKLFGEENAKYLINANRLLDEMGAGSDIKNKVLEIISTMGYNKYLEGTRPVTLEGQIVSDADMCDAIGAMGILRTHAYNLSKGGVFFDKTISPVNNKKSSLEYRNIKHDHAVQHFFDKLLIIPSILMTASGKEEGDKRLSIMVNFLDELFTEENAGDWTIYLNSFVMENSASH
jgi:uncharacterized protein